MEEFLFPEDIGPASGTKLYDKYEVFPAEYEKDEWIVFHGTSWNAFEKIKLEGFRLVTGIPSTSFAYSSQHALEYACKKRSLGDCGVVIMVKFKPEHKVKKEPGGHWHLYDHANSQPEIIGYCTVPENYRHI